MKKVVIMEHSRGNHSARQVYEYGRKIFEGNATEVRKELARMRRWCREDWYSACTESKQSDYVAYKMGTIFSIDVTDGIPKWF